MEKILQALKQKYDPVAIITYGSYSDGTNDPDSDFDAMVLTKSGKPFHDTSVVQCVRLDVFVYPMEILKDPVDCDQFMQIMNGNVVFDTDGMGATFLQTIQQHAAAYTLKSKEDLSADVDWCKKMLLRAQRNDAEGMFRWHWLLTESLQIFCDIKHNPYVGPKKTLKWMQASFPECYELYQDALFTFAYPALSKWIAALVAAWDNLEK